MSGGGGGGGGGGGTGRFQAACTRAWEAAAHSATPLSGSAKAGHSAASTSPRVITAVESGSTMGALRCVTLPLAHARAKKDAGATGGAQTREIREPRRRGESEGAGERQRAEGREGETSEARCE